MKATATLLVLSLLSLAGACKSTNKLLDDLTYGAPYEADYEMANERARFVLSRVYPKGLDPDKSKEEDGDYVTVWHYQKSALYRKTTRERAHVKVEDLGSGKVRLGISVVQQLNDNIDNPSSIGEAKWVAAQRNAEVEGNLERRIAKRYTQFEVSTYYKEKNSDKKRTGLRPDLIERYEDVNLEEMGEIDKYGENPAGFGDDGYTQSSHEERDRKKTEAKVLEVGEVEKDPIK